MLIANIYLARQVKGLMCKRGCLANMLLQSVIAQKVGAVILPNVGGMAGALFFNPGQSAWYKCAIARKVGAVILLNVGGIVGALLFKPGQSAWYKKVYFGSMTVPIGTVILPNVSGMAGVLLFWQGQSPRYKDLKKPSWNPPAWVFAPVWTSLYCGMGYASYLVYKDGGGFEGAKLPLTLYGAQLALNWSWTPMFFGLESTKYGLINFAFLLPTVAGATYEFFKVNQVAGGLMVPYLMWISFACFLNFTIHQLNQKSIEPKK